MNFRTAYSWTRKQSEAFATINTEESLTQQSDALDLDINIIMSRFGQTGQLPNVVEPGKYGDFSNAPTFREAQDIIHQANEMFGQIPAKIRKQFDNDPAQFLDFVNNPDNIEELRKMGLAAPEPPKVPTGDQDEINRYTQRTERYDDNTGYTGDNGDQNGEQRQRSTTGGSGGQPRRQGGQGSTGLPERSSEPQGGSSRPGGR